MVGELVKGFVTGLQGPHPRYIRANACCKSFAAYTGPANIPESRYSFNAEVKWASQFCGLNGGELRFGLEASILKWSTIFRWVLLGHQ